MANFLKNKNSSSQAGVTIAELSIVIAIIGLLIGIVASGYKLRKAAELRAIITDESYFREAFESFQSKYSQLPGDMADAYTYWGASCDATNTKCNGNGDGNIDINMADGTDSETFRFWQHLNLAGFIDGGYTGVSNSTTVYGHTPGINCPATKRSTGGWHARTHTNDDVTVATTNIEVGGFRVTSDWTANKLFTPAEASSIDVKTDDGDPDNGKTQSRGYYNGSAWQTTCISGSDPSRAYIMTTTTQECIMFFDLQ